ARIRSAETLFSWRSAISVSVNGAPVFVSTSHGRIDHVDQAFVPITSSIATPPSRDAPPRVQPRRSHAQRNCRRTTKYTKHTKAPAPAEALKGLAADPRRLTRTASAPSVFVRVCLWFNLSSRPRPAPYFVYFVVPLDPPPPLPTPPKIPHGRPTQP